MIEEFVNSEIDKHKERYGLDFGFNICSEIIKYVEEGIYAFQLIYNENHQVVLVKPLDWTRVIENSSSRHWGPKTKFIQDLWSYDGGKQFKYSLIETLKLDIQKLRDMKLNNIGI